MIKVAVGSENPAKNIAVKDVFEEMFSDKLEIISVSIDSGVSIQPFDEKTIKGAYNRAKGALTASNADFGVGIEGGVMKLGEKWYNLGFVVIMDRDGNMGTGTSGWFECPKFILDELRKGNELGDVMDKLSGTTDSKKKEGAIGILTKNHVTRKDLYKHGVQMALVPLLNKSLWDKRCDNGAAAGI